MRLKSRLVVFLKVGLLLLILYLGYKYYFWNDIEYTAVANRVYKKQFSPSIFATVVGLKPYPFEAWIKNTWYKRTDDYQLFSPYPNNNVTMYLPRWFASPSHDITSGNLHWWLSKWLVGRNDTSNYDFYVFTLDSTYLITNNLRQNLRQFDKNQKSFFVIGNCSNSANHLPAIVLSNAMLHELSKHSNYAKPNDSDICKSLKALNADEFELNVDEAGKMKYLDVQRHFSRSEMDVTQAAYGKYTDGKEIFEKLSSGIIAFHNVTTLEHEMLDTYLYRLNKREL